MQDVPKSPSQVVGTFPPANAVLCVPATLLVARKWIRIEKAKLNHICLDGGGSWRWARALLDL
ncbi:hypothetical protein CGRA01v4_14535 [Colletotrichum graminicola]|nr:hypothetical protein CGRA01v4_14535 [Colletotrichum graminicola]